jgi:hypothetical protein
MKVDRMTAFEAPRVSPPSRPMREVTLRLRGHNKDGRSREVVHIPKAMPPPDLITYRGRTFVRRNDSLYAEGSVWPIINDLDGNT